MKTSIAAILILMGIPSTGFSQTALEARLALENYELCVANGNREVRNFCNSAGSYQVSYPYTFLVYATPSNLPNIDYTLYITCPVVRPDLPGGYDFFGTSIYECHHPKTISSFKPTSVIDTSHDVSALPKNQLTCPGSVIQLDSRSVGEQIQLSGIPFELSYQTQFDPARTANRKINLTMSFEGELQVPRSIRLTGQNSPVKRFEFPAMSSIAFDYLWDSSDLISRSPFIDSEDFALDFVSAFNSGVPSRPPKCGIGTVGSSPVATNCESPDSIPKVTGDNNVLSKRYKLVSYKPAVWGLGGWTLTNHHFYDHITKAIYYGFGQARNVEGISRTLAPYGVVTLIADQNGSEVYVFDTSGKHVETRTALMGAVKYKFLYLDDHKLDQIIDQNNLVTRILRNSSGAPTGIQSPYGVLTTVELNSAGKLSLVKTAAGKETSITYLGNNGLLDKIYYPSGLITTFEHTADGLFLRETNNNGGSQALTESFENLKKLIGFSTAEGVSLESIDDRSGADVVRTSKNGLGIQSSENRQSTDGSAELNIQENFRTSINFQNDVRFGSQVPFAAAATQILQGNETFFRNDVASQEVSYQNGAGPFSINKLTTTVNNLNIPIVGRTVFDGVEKSYSVYQNNVLLSKVHFDDKERISTLKSSGALDLNLVYNSYGQISQVGQGRSIFNYYYDAKGNLLQERDARNRVTSYQRDEDGKVLVKTLPNGDQINFEYTASGSLKSLKTPNNQTHNFQHNLLDTVASYIPPIFLSEGGATTYTYDLDGRIKTITKPGGKIATIYYQSATGYVERIATPDGDYLFQNFDSIGRVGRIVSPDGIVTTNTYIEEKIVNQQWNHAPTGDSGSMRFSLNALRQVTNIAYSAFENGIQLEYDSSGRIIRSGDETYSYSTSNSVVNDANVASQTVTSTLANNLVTTSSVETSDVLGADPTVRSIRMRIPLTNGSLTVETAENVDEVGNISISAKKSLSRTNQIKEDGISQHYIYDPNNRLIQIDEEESHNLNGVISQVPRRPIAEYTFGAGSNNNIQTYEHFGKRTVASYGAQDRLLKLQGAIQRDFEYTAEGTISKISNCLGEKKFEYDFFGNLKRVTMPDGKIISYKYDGFNRRTLKLINNQVVERYTWMDQLRLARIDSSLSGARISYIYGSHPIVPSYVMIGNFRYKVVPTWKGDIRYIVGEDGTVVQELQYDEYGNVLKDTSLGRVVNGQTFNVPLQPLGFVSGLTDHDTKMIRFGARDYDPVVGRWTAKDPIGFAGGDTNLYSYVGQNPLNAIDPSGLSDINLFPLGDPLLAWDTRINTPSNIFSVGGHGSPTRIVDPYGNTLSPEDLANLIRKNSKYQPGMQVELNSCSTGGSSSDGAASYAQRLSNILNAQVTAPTNTLFINSKGGRRVLDPGGFRTFSPNR